MKKFINYCTISLAATLALAAITAHADSGAAPIPKIIAVSGDNVRVVKANNVNLRARPSRNAEVIMQLNKGDELNVLDVKPITEAGKTQEWARVQLPAAAKCYVLAKLLADGKATGDAINIRSGPGTNFKDIGKLAKGQKADVVKTTGEWMQIKPTPQCSGWVATDYLEAAPAPTAPPVPPAPPIITNVVEVATPPISIESLPTPAPMVITPPAPETLSYYVVKDGIFRTVDQSELDGDKQLAPYELMTIMFERRHYRIAFLEVSEKDLNKYQGKHVRILGNLRWKRGDRDPVIVVDRIEPVW